MHSIQRDMIMLENQLPLFVLDRLLGLQTGTPNQTGIVAEVAVRFFKTLMPTSEVLTKSERSLDSQEKSDELGDNGGLHCLDVFHRSLIQSSETTNQGTPYEDMSMVEKQQQLIHCVTELRGAGVNFMRKETGQLWDIEFKNGYLKIPKLLIHDGELTGFFFSTFLLVPHKFLLSIIFKILQFDKEYICYQNTVVSLVSCRYQVSFLKSYCFRAVPYTIKQQHNILHNLHG